MNSSQQPQPLPTRVKLLSHSTHPIATLFLVWRQSRSNSELPSAKEISDLLYRADFTLNKEKEDDTPYLPPYRDCVATASLLGFDSILSCAAMITAEVEMLMAESIPVTETLNFTFLLENIPISLREQLVRHRIGTAVDPRLGADGTPYPFLSREESALALRAAGFPEGSFMEVGIIPDLASSSFWSQTSRIIPAQNFYDEGRWVLPASLEGKSIPGKAYTAEERYRYGLEVIQEIYRDLVAAGVHIEDARQLIPVGSTHSITWSLNFKAMQHIIGKRSCFIAQLGIWEPVIIGMISELQKVHPLLASIANPPCVKRGKYIGCPVKMTNIERIQGKDGTMPPCPLFVRYETETAIDAQDGQENPKWFPDVDATFTLTPYSPTRTLDPTQDVCDIRKWMTTDVVSREMLDNTSSRFFSLWGLDQDSPGLEVK